MAGKPKVKAGRAIVNLKVRRTDVTSEVESEVSEEHALLIYLLCCSELNPAQQSHANALLKSLRGHL